MRTAIIVSALTLSAISSPASATYTVTGIYGDSVRTTVTLACNSASPIGCQGNTGYGTNSVTYQSYFSAGPYLTIANEGDTFFSGLELQYHSFFSFTINNMNGILTGRDLSINYYSNQCAYGGAIGCILTDGATATAFNVTGGVPEPSTWAMMLLGFGAIGYSMRRSRKVARSLSA